MRRESARRISRAVCTENEAKPGAGGTRATVVVDRGCALCSPPCPALEQEPLWGLLEPTAGRWCCARSAVWRASCQASGVRLLGTAARGRGRIVHACVVCSLPALAVGKGRASGLVLPALVVLNCPLEEARGPKTNGPSPPVAAASLARLPLARHTRRAACAATAGRPLVLRPTPRRCAAPQRRSDAES
jgi:hypothetical protein